MYERGVVLGQEDSLSKIAELIAPRSTVLELGTATGYFAEFLAKRGECVVDGVEVDPAMAESAQRWYRELVVGDLSRLDLAEHFGDSRYDYIIAADVLEHLVDPEAVVRAATALLKRSGRMIFSFPNVSHAGVIAELMSGDLQYRAEGLLDRSHLRFFTRNSLMRLLGRCDLGVEHYLTVRKRLADTEFRDHLNRLGPRTVQRLVTPEDAEVYQHIVCCRPTHRGAVLGERVEAYLNDVLLSVTPPHSIVRPPAPAFATYTIVIPVHNAFEALRACVARVLRFTDPRHRIVVLDDGSTDPRVGAALKEWEGARESLATRASAQPRGLVATVNEAFHTTQGDLILLNSDTLVGPGWLERLDRCAGSDENIGIVCPLSNNATILSLPVLGTGAEPGEAAVRSATELIAQTSGRHYPRLPTAVGFCMLIKRAVIDAIGEFDVLFSPGYGEECDYSMRAWNAGFEIACCDDAYVYHAGGASFGADAQVRRLRAEHDKFLQHRWPRYGAAVDLFRRQNPLLQLQCAVLAQRETADTGRRHHVLYVLHQMAQAAGVEQHAQDLAERLDETYRWSMLIPRSSGGAAFSDVRVLEESGAGRILELLTETQHGDPFFLGMRSSLLNEPLDRRFAKFLAGSAVDVVHFHQVGNWGSLALPLIAKSLGKTVVFSLHDYFLLCPEYQLLSPDLVQCGKVRANPDDAECVACLGRKDRGLPALTADALREYLEQRRILVDAVVAAVDGFVAPSEHVKDAFLTAFGERISNKLEVIGYGIPKLPRRVTPKPNGTLKVGFVGHLSPRKGGHVFLSAASLLKKEGGFDFHVFGPVHEQLRPMAEALGVAQHGLYRREQLPQLLRAVDVGVIPSLFAETFCLALEETLAVGVPVIASEVGAITSRIDDGVTGFLVPPGDVEALVSKLRWISNNRPRLREIGRRLNSKVSKTLEMNAREHVILYGKLLAEADSPPLCAPAAYAREDSALRSELRDLLGPGRPFASGPPDSVGSALYRHWIAKKAAARQTESTDTPAMQDMPNASAGPVFHLLVSGVQSDSDWLKATLHTLRAQAYAHCRTTIVADMSVPAWMKETVGRSGTQWVQTGKHISRKTAINRLCAKVRSDWIALLSPGDLLDDRLLSTCARYIAERPQWRLIYFDSDLHDGRGGRYAPSFKPDFNLELLRSTPYVEGFCVVRKDALLALGGFSGEESVEHQDLVLRLYEASGPGALGHVSEVFLHRLDQVEKLLRGARAARSWQVVTEHLARLAIPAGLEQAPDGEALRVRYQHSGRPQISACIATGGDPVRLEQCLSSVIDRIAYDNLELLVLAPPLPTPAMESFLTLIQSRTSIRVIAPESDDAEAPVWNFATEARGDFLWLLDDSIEVARPDTLDALLELGRCADVGVVGGVVLDVHGQIVDGARILGGGSAGLFAPAFRAGGQMGFLDRTTVAQDVSAVSPSCLLVRTALYLEAGGLRGTGFDRDLAATEFCLRVGELGKRVVWTPYAPVVRAAPMRLAERHTANPQQQEARAELYRRWQSRLSHDPAYNRHLNLLRSNGTPEVEVDVPWDPALRGRSRVIGFPGDTIGTAQYRVLGPLRALRHAGHMDCAVMPEHAAHRTPTVTEILRARPDAILLQNTLHDFQLEAMEDYRRSTGCLIVFGQDDLLTAVPPKNPFSQSGYKDIALRIEKALRLCHRLIVSTEPLAEKYRRLVKDVRIIPNRLARFRWEGISVTRSRHGKPRVGWAGAPQHLGDLEVIAGAVQQTADEVDWIFFGMCPEVLRPYVREFHPVVPFDAYPAKLASLALDLAVAPLEYNAFNEAKSNLRLLEYGALGYPVICTDIVPYRDAPVARVANEAAAWVEAIRERVASPERLQSEGEDLRAWVDARFWLEDHLDEWEAALSC